MSLLKCPHCGFKYPSGQEDDGWPGLVPVHTVIINNPRYMSSAALDSGALEEAIDCPGTHQAPRNAETDHRRLWKDGGEP